MRVCPDVYKAGCLQEGWTMTMPTHFKSNPRFKSPEMKLAVGIEDPRGPAFYHVPPAVVSSAAVPPIVSAGSSEWLSTRANGSGADSSAPRVAVCLKGDWVSGPGINSTTGFLDHFWRPGYDLFVVANSKGPLTRWPVSVEAALPPGSIKGMALIDWNPKLKAVESHCKAGDPKVPTSARWNDLSGSVQGMWMGHCYGLVRQEERRNGQLYDYVVHADPEIRYTRTVPHVAELHAKLRAVPGDKRNQIARNRFSITQEQRQATTPQTVDVVIWDNQLAISPRPFAEELFMGAMLSSQRCYGSIDWTLACGLEASEVDLDAIRNGREWSNDASIVRTATLTRKYPCSLTRLAAVEGNFTLRDCGTWHSSNCAD